jgi:putative molybdopterin biosynthesis protein
MDRLISIDQPQALKAVADPKRLELLRRLMASKETISSLGQAMGKHPAWIRHHVKALEAAGLVALVEERTTRNYTEKFYRACAPAFTVSMLLRPELHGERPLVALASSDFALELLADEVAADTRMVSAVAGSLDCLIGVRQGLADIAGCHLLDAESGQYNLPYARHLFPDRDVVVVTLAHREQGLIVAPGNPLKLTSVADIAERGARFVNRNRGSGTRLWLDRHLSEAGVASEAIAGFGTEVNTHTQAAAVVASGAADAALGVRAAAGRAALGFVPLFSERYDLVMPADVYRTEEAERVLDRLHQRTFRRAVAGITGYDSHATGQEYRVAV